MAYLGQPPFQEFTNPPTKDDFTGDGSTTVFDLDQEVASGSQNALEVFIDNVRQEPGTGKAFILGVDGSGDHKRITFSSAPASGASIYVINDKTNQTVVAPLSNDLNGTELILDVDGDTSITADTDDRIDFKIANVEHISLSNSSGDTIIKPRVDAKDIVFQQFDGNKILCIDDGNFVSVGGNATAPGEIRIYEDTDNGTHYSGFKVGNLTSSVAYQLPLTDATASGQALTSNSSGVLSWSTVSANVPTSADGQALGSASLEWSDLFLADGAVINFGADQDINLTHVADTGLTTNGTFTTTGLILGSTAVTSTAAELNLIDGGTSRGTTAVADGDGILINDGGTMRMTTVQTVSTYMAAESVGGGNIVTTGALGSGSIAAGFGAIDNGASNITNGGLLHLDVDSDADDVTGDSATGRLTIGAGQDLNLYHGGTNSYIVNDTGDLIIKTGASDEDFIIQGNDGGSAITPFKLDMSAGGDLFLTGGLIDLKNDGSNVSQIKFYCESSNAHAQTLIGAPHAESGSNTLTLPSSGGNSKLLSATSTATVTNKTLTTPKINENVALTSTASELNILDGATVVVGEINALDLGSTAVGTGVASKAVILDSSLDYTGIRNLTITGEIDAATGDFSGAVDIAGATTVVALTASGAILPAADDATDLGSASKQFRNIYTGDLHLSNMSKAAGNVVDGTKGDWTIQEGAEELYLMNNNSGKKYKFNLTEV